MKPRNLGLTLVVLLASGALLFSLVLVALARQVDGALQSVSASYAAILLPLQQIDINTNKLRFHLLAAYMHNPALGIEHLHDHPLALHLSTVRAELAANDALWRALAAATPMPADLAQLRASYRAFEQNCVVPSLAAVPLHDWRGVVAPVTATLPAYLAFAQRLQEHVALLRAGEYQRTRSVMLRQYWLFGAISIVALCVLALAGCLAWRAMARHEAALRHSQRELARANAGLERKVAWRTRELRSANRQLMRALRRLQAVKAQAVQHEKFAALGNLVAGVAHELNTPIGNALLTVGTLAGLTAQLRRTLDHGITRRQLQAHLCDTDDSCRMIERALSRASGLLDSFKQIAADPRKERRRRFELADVVADLVAARRGELLRAGCKVQLGVPRGLSLDSYPDSVIAVLNQLVDNSLRHGFAHGAQGTLTISAVDLNPQLLMLTVRDDGAGIAPQLRHRVFDPFFTTRMGQGSGGLGLAIVHNIVTVILGGRIALADAACRGTVLEITLRKRVPEQEETGLAARPMRPSLEPA